MRRAPTKASANVETWQTEDGESCQGDAGAKTRTEQVGETKTELELEIWRLGLGRRPRTL